MQLTIVHVQTPINIQLSLHAMIFVTVDSQLLTVFDISNLTQCPIHHSVYLQFNVALLFRYSKSQFK
jgi:hypothetical protein